MSEVVTHHGRAVQEPRFMQFLLNDSRAGWLWLIPRVYLGSQWFEAALHKIHDPAWIGGGSALKGFWEEAVVLPPPPAGQSIGFEWYRSFLQALLDAEAYTWFAKLVTYGELLVGIALILGAFTGIAAFLGGFMNWNYMMAGTAATNPLLFTIAVLLIMAWKVAGYIGADFFLLPWLGTPWRDRPLKPMEHSASPAGG